MEAVAKSALCGLGGVFQGAIIAKQGLIFIVNRTEQALIGLLPKGGAAQFVSPDLDAVAGRGPVFRRHGFAIGQPFDPEVEYQRGCMGAAPVVNGYDSLRQHRKGSYGDLIPPVFRGRGQEFSKTFRRSWPGDKHAGPGEGVRSNEYPCGIPEELQIGPVRKRLDTKEIRRKRKVDASEFQSEVKSCREVQNLAGRQRHPLYGRGDRFEELGIPTRCQQPFGQPQKIVLEEDGQLRTAPKMPNRLAVQTSQEPRQNLWPRWA